MRLSRFEDGIIRGNAQYFREQGFINDEMYRRVHNWLDGKEDDEAQKAVMSWMESDAKWIASIESRAMAYFWYIAPAVKLESDVIRKILLSRVKKLSKKSQGNGKARVEPG